MAFWGVEAGCRTQTFLTQPSIPFTLMQIMDLQTMLAWGMCLVKHVQDVRCCCHIWYDGERIVYISSIERKEFALSLKVYLDVGYEHIS